MKRIMMVAAIIMLLTGCGGIQVRDSSMIAPPKINVAPPAGYVPVHIQNPDLLSQKVCFFEGSTSVQVIPDPRGGWKSSRPAFVCYRVEGANSENNWYGYSQIFLPRNFNFVVSSQIIGVFGGENWPSFQSYRTGANPGAQSYTSITPSRRQEICGALVHLQRQPSSVQPFNVNIDIDFRPIGAAITNGLTNTIYGR